MQIENGRRYGRAVPGNGGDRAIRPDAPDATERNLRVDLLRTVDANHSEPGSRVPTGTARTVAVTD